MNSAAPQHSQAAAVSAANMGMGNARRRLSARVLALRASDLITRLGKLGLGSLNRKRAIYVADISIEHYIVLRAIALIHG